MKKLMMSLLVLLLMAGGGDKKIDASTDEAMTQSIEEIKESLSGEKKKEFSEAVKLVALSGIGNLFAAAMNPDGVQDKLKEKLQGKTADEVIAAARSILAERRKKEQQQALDEIVELRKEIAELEMQRLKGDRAT
ncbi:MAG: hypothetical protein HRT88_10445 [Lentisphaeraceae bacterium]|nr:hypothetical protein [Lentisphaeraceae bacterium]